jgi:hypothetical protein
MKILEGYKTYIMAIAAFMVAAGVGIQAYYNGDAVQWQLVIDALIALAMVFLRQGIKTGPAAPPGE